MTEEQKIDLKERMLNDDNLDQVSGGVSVTIACPKCNGKYGLRPGPRPGTYDCPHCGIVKA